MRKQDVKSDARLPVRRRQRALESLPAEVGFLALPDGAEIYFEDSGGTGPVLFFIYGLGCSIRHWKYPRAHFSTLPVRQVWIDFRGHGRSPALAPAKRLSFPMIVDDIRSLCAARGIHQAIFLGQSMGGAIALQLAHDAPQLVSALILLASPGRDPGLSMPPLMRWLWQGLLTFSQTAPELIAGIYQNNRWLATQPALWTAITEFVRFAGFNPELAQRDDIDEYVRSLLEVDARLFFNLANDLKAFDVQRLGPTAPTCPALVIAGAGDKIVPLNESRRLAAALAGSELVVVEHGSHCPHFDDPGLVSRRIEGFLRQHGLLS